MSRAALDGFPLGDVEPQLNPLRPDEIKATKISSRWNKGNKDSIGQVGQAVLRN
jgi:hypothetical protein